MILCLIIFCIFIIIINTNPYIDYYKDKEGKNHIVLWYDSLYGNRHYIVILGDRE